MGWISFLFILSTAFAQVKTTGPERLLTKHSIDAIRYIDGDGRVAYVKKRSGVLGLVSSFRSEDFLTDAPGSDFIVTATPLKRKVIVEVVQNQHTVYDVLKSNKLIAYNWGETKGKDIGMGMASKLHLTDEWASFYKPNKKSIIVKNIVTEKEYEIKLGTNANPYFIPEVVMVASDLIVYSDQNAQGLAAVVSYNLLTKKTEIIHKSTQNGTKIELCVGDGYLALGEFPYDGVNRGSKILHLKTLSTFSLTGFSTIYESSAQDIGNMVCKDDSIFFIKTMSQKPEIGHKTTEAVKLDIKTSQIQQKTNLGSATQLLSMDGKILLSHREVIYVLEGEYDLSKETLSKPSLKEEL